MFTENKHLGLLFGISILLPLIFTHMAVSLVSIALTLFLVWKDKKNGLLLLFVYFPIRPFLIEINNGFKLLGDVVIVFLFVLTIIEYIKHKKSLSPLTKYLVTIGIPLFCLTGTIAAFTTGVDLEAIVFQNRAFLITFLLVFVVGELTFTRKDIKRFVGITVIMGTILSIHGLIEFISSRTLFVPEAWENWNLSSVNEMRVYGLTANPNVLGTYLSICLFATLYAYQTFQKYKWPLISAAILMLGVLCLTYSRGSILAFGIAFILYILLRKDWKMLKSFVAVVVIGLCIIYYPANAAKTFVAQESPDRTNPSSQVDEQDNEEEKDHNKTNQRPSSTFSNRFKEIFSDDIIQKSTEWGRLYVVFKGIDIYMEHPVIGTGFGTFGDSATLSYGSPISDQYGLPDRMYSDNQYIQFLVQTGTIGTFFVLFFIVGIMIQLWKRRDETISPVLFSLILAALLMALFYNVLEEKILTLYFYTLLGYFLYKERDLLEDEPSR
ncbi:O-antigen ligase family protein [Rossellomorea aquimaris]|nr:O-antigen ligase family protein [Rossellomorea aquimaris]WRP06358.1 O-antigen ligase family protein [Rossellomorea aquimaris]